MPATEQDKETCRIILLRGKQPKVWLACEGKQRALPELAIPCWQRVAECLTTGLKDTLGSVAISLCSLEAPSIPSSPAQTRYEVLEWFPTNEEVQRRGSWMSLADLDEIEFRDPNDLSAVRRAVAQCHPLTGGGRFDRLGWFKELRHWVQEEIEPQGLHLCGQFRQLNASGMFSLIRFQTDGPAVWFKAVDEPNVREYRITLTLARFFPRFIAPIIAKRPEWNGWLALEAEGILLQQAPEPASWVIVARNLAELQIASLGRCLHLIEAGARDLRKSALAACVEPFFGSMVEWMKVQTKLLPEPLGLEELRRLAAHIHVALAVLEETNFPSALGHLDLNPGNIVASAKGAMFLDWADAFVGHPFLSFQYFMEHFRRTFGKARAHEKQIVRSYSSPWRAFVSEEAISCALDVVPLLAVFACAVGNDFWADVPRSQDSRMAGYLRALARRMHREARSLPVRSSLWRN